MLQILVSDADLAHVLLAEGWADGVSAKSVEDLSWLLHEKGSVVYDRASE